MTAVLRQNAVIPMNLGIGQAQLRGGGGDGRAYPLGGRPPVKVGPKVRYSADPAAELMPAAEFLGAEPDFAAVLEDFGDSPFNPARRSVLGRLMGVFAMDYQAARTQERAFLRRLLLARNAREGYAANRGLHLCGAPHAIRRTLALGVAEARWEGGAARPYLGCVQARVAATTLALLGARGREHVWNLLTLAGHQGGALARGADPVIERALVLKALGARRHRLGPWRADGPAALDEVTEFAEQIRGCWRLTLAARTTLFPGDPLRTAKPLAQQQGAGRAAYIARGDIDPVFAWKEHGVRKEQAPADAAPYEDIYAALPDIDRSPLLDRPRLHQALAEARAAAEAEAGSLTLEQIEAIGDHLAGRDLSGDREAVLLAGLEVLQRRGFDLIRPEALAAIRDDARGIYKFDAAQGFGLLLCRYTGAVYVRRLFSDQMTAGLDPLPQIGHAVRCGLVVPLLLRDLRSAAIKEWTVLAERSEGDQRLFALRRPSTDAELEVPAAVLLQPQLPEPFGRKIRADTFLAPAALDLLAPPFGIPFPALGIRDGL